MMPSIPLSFETNSRTRVVLPPDDPRRRELHDEVHARPTARIRLPALVLQVAVLNEGVTVDSELEHLRRLPGQRELLREQLAGHFLRLRLPSGTLKWERHTEVTRYSLVQPLPAESVHGASDPELLAALIIDHDWLGRIPGRTLSAIELVLLAGSEQEVAAPLERARHWFGDHTVVTSLVGRNGHSSVVTDFRLRPSGYERMLVIAPPGTGETRVGRLAARLLDIEIYRLLALRGLPVAKSLQPMLREAEQAIADVTSSMETHDRSAAELLETLAAVAARVERATAMHIYRFCATEAYDALVRARIAELREQAFPGTQTLGEFLQRRLAPAMATVDSAAGRLASLSQRIERAGALLRTRVDIAREAQNQELLAKLARGQQLQLRLQSTVEGLSIAAISYYVVSLLLYAAKAAKAAGVPIQPELAIGATIPLVLWGVWRLTRRIHNRLQLHD
ncbi:MAG: DUF3422 domain-containing protein [Dechloromonas sp.]|nr:DUF3422 domain-containing protein [Dechloromonas sp. CZR5]MBS4020177.1 DUF3422 domain-containing protein [Dechloromonas sp.]